MKGDFSCNITSNLVPVAYESRKLQGTKVNFDPCERKCLVAVWAVQSFKPLTGIAHITIQNTHSPLKYMISGKLVKQGV